jgi:hypothetical protein
MTFECAHCRGLYFKTLETRILSESEAILYKKRCKRCKYKVMLRKDGLTGATRAIGREEWLRGRKVTLAGGRIAERTRIFIGEYSSRVSRAVDTQLPYLRKIAQAENSTHATQADHSKPGTYPQAEELSRSPR